MQGILIENVRFRKPGDKSLYILNIRARVSEVYVVKEWQPRMDGLKPFFGNLGFKID